VINRTHFTQKKAHLPRGGWAGWSQPEGWTSGKNFEAHRGDTAGRDTEIAGSTLGQIDDPTAGEGAAVIDPNDGRTAVVEVGDLYTGAKGKAAVGGRIGAWAKDLTIGSAVAVETGPASA
jgi:hypothetical protein